MASQSAVIYPPKTDTERNPALYGPSAWPQVSRIRRPLNHPREKITLGDPGTTDAPNPESYPFCRRTCGSSDHCEIEYP